MCLARSPSRVTQDIHDNPTAAVLTDEALIPKESYCPLVPVNFHTVPSLMPCDYYIKRPNLMGYDPKSKVLEGSIQQDLEACEILRRNPHPNIATYYGCETHDGRVTGLCFPKYQSTLMERLNPRHLSKYNFVITDRNISKDLANRYLCEVEAGKQHMHSLGLIHNDINPNNIMFNSDDIPSIIDFDSCHPRGSDLTLTKRTYQWHDPKEKYSVESNDLDALNEIRIWLTESPDQFLFGL